MEKRQNLKIVFIIITIIIMIPVTAATVMWLLANIGTKSFLFRLIFLPIQLTFVGPIIKWGIFIILIIWTIYWIINRFNKNEESSKIEKI